MHVPRFFRFFFPNNSFLKKFPKITMYLIVIVLYLSMHNSHFILFCIFSLSNVFNMSLWLGRLCNLFPRLRHEKNYSILFFYMKLLDIFIGIQTGKYENKGASIPIDKRK